jgi:hypothetical protein
MKKAKSKKIMEAVLAAHQAGIQKGAAAAAAAPKPAGGPPMAPPGAPPMGGAPMRPPGMKKGGEVESKEMMKKEISFFKRKGAPKSMIRHEEAEMKNKYASGGRVGGRGDGCAQRGKTRGRMV